MTDSMKGGFKCSWFTMLLQHPHARNDTRFPSLHVTLYPSMGSQSGEKFRDPFLTSLLNSFLGNRNISIHWIDCSL